MTSADESSERILHRLVELVPVAIIVIVSSVAMAVIAGMRSLAAVAEFALLITVMWVVISVFFMAVEWLEERYERV